MREERAQSPRTPEPPSPIESEETEEHGRTGGTTIAATAAQAGVTSSETTPILNPEQMRHIIASLSGATRNLKAKEKEVYRGEQQ